MSMGGAKEVTLKEIRNLIPSESAVPPRTPVRASALSTTVVTVSGAGILDSIILFNPNTSVAYVQIFDISGTVTLGTSIPRLSIGVPKEDSVCLSGLNLKFPNAIKVAATTTAAGSSAPSTALDCNFGVG